MSTRSYVGDAKTKRAVYVHFDGYPEGRLPILAELIQRDGAEKVIQTIMSARTGGWSYLLAETDVKIDSGLGDRGAYVNGYGLRYTDLQTEDGEPTYVGDGMSEDERIWIEYVYLIDPETGVITWWSTGEDSPQFQTFDPAKDSVEAG